MASSRDWHSLSEQCWIARQHVSHSIKSAESLRDKASEKMGEMATDEVMASAIVRAVTK
jgi:hypothetical protein